MDRLVLAAAMVILAGGIGWILGSISECRDWRSGIYPVKDYEDGLAKRKWRDAEPKGEAQ